MTEAAEILKKVRKIEIKTRGLSKHLFSGEYHSAFKGRGMSFSEVRDYHYGDDVRNIDWNVTARTGTPHIKVFEEDRELTVMLMIDISQSSYFGTVNKFKSEWAAEIAAVIAFSAYNNNDKVGAILFTDRVEKYIPPKKGRKHILMIIREIIYFEPLSAGTDVNEALIYLNNIRKKRSIVFLMSDFRSPPYDNALSVAARRHDIIGMALYDPLERELPPAGLLRGVDAETGEEVILDSSSQAVRKAYSDSFNDNFVRFNESFLKSKSDALSIEGRDDYVKKLLSFFKKRSK